MFLPESSDRDDAALGLRCPNPLVGMLDPVVDGVAQGVRQGVTQPCCDVCADREVLAGHFQIADPLAQLAAQIALTGKPLKELATVMTKLNEGLLREIAAKADGRYVHSASGDLGIGDIAEELDRMDKSEFESRLLLQYEDRYAYAAYPGFLLLLVGAALRGRRMAVRAA